MTTGYDPQKDKLLATIAEGPDGDGATVSVELWQYEGSRPKVRVRRTYKGREEVIGKFSVGQYRVLRAAVPKLDKFFETLFPTQAASARAVG